MKNLYCCAIAYTFPFKAAPPACPGCSTRLRYDAALAGPGSAAARSRRHRPTSRSASCLLAGLPGSMTWAKGKPEPEVAGPVAGDVPVADSRPAEPGPDVPRAAANDPVRAIIRSDRVFSRTGFIIVLIEPIRTPFPYISAHVQQTEMVDAAGKTPNRACSSDSCIVKICLIRVRGVAPGKLPTLTASGGLFPLGFGWQGYTPPPMLEFFRQPLAIGMCIMP